MLGALLGAARAASVNDPELLLFRMSDVTNPERNNSSPTMMVTGVYKHNAYIRPTEGRKS
jgi:hypothetical protein